MVDLTILIMIRVNLKGMRNGNDAALEIRNGRDGVNEEGNVNGDLSDQTEKEK